MINLFFWVVNILIMISTWIARKDPPTLRVLSAKHSGFLCRGFRIRVDRKVAMGQVVCCVFNLSCSDLLCFQFIMQWSAVFSTYPAVVCCVFNLSCSSCFFSAHSPLNPSFDRPTSGSISIFCRALDY